MIDRSGNLRGRPLPSKGKETDDDDDGGGGDDDDDDDGNTDTDDDQPMVKVAKGLL